MRPVGRPRRLLRMGSVVVRRRRVPGLLRVHAVYRVSLVTSYSSASSTVFSPADIAVDLYIGNTQQILWAPLLGPGDGILALATAILLYPLSFPLLLHSSLLFLCLRFILIVTHLTTKHRVVLVLSISSIHKHKPQLQQTTAALLLPVVPAVVASASGGILAAALPSRSHAVTTLIVSYVLWGLGETFTCCILALYFHRLLVHHLPPRELIVSVFLPVGPLGQGGFAIQQLGAVAADLGFLPFAVRSAATDGDVVGFITGGQVLQIIGIFLALIMWGAGLGWLVLAATSIATTQSFPFNMGWWGFTFPLGVFATCTSMLAQQLDSVVFRVLTMVSGYFLLPFAGI